MLYGEESCRFILDMHFKPDLTLPAQVDRIRDAFGPVPHALVARVAYNEAKPVYGYAVQLLRLRAHPNLADFLDLIAGMEVYECLRLLGVADNDPIDMPSDRTWSALGQRLLDSNYCREREGPRMVRDIANTIVVSPYPHVSIVVDLALRARVALGQISAEAEVRGAFVRERKLSMLHQFLGHAGCRIPAADELD